MKKNILVLLALLIASLYADTTPPDSNQIVTQPPEVTLYNSVKSNQGLSQDHFTEWLTLLDTSESPQRDTLFSSVKQFGTPAFIPLLNSYKNGQLTFENGYYVIYTMKKAPDGAVNYIPTTVTFDSSSTPKKLSTVTRISNDNIKALRSDRRSISNVIQILSLTSPDITIQRNAITSVTDKMDITLLPFLYKIESTIPYKNREILTESLARLTLAFGTDLEKLDAAFTLGEIGSSRAVGALEKALKAPPADGATGFTHALNTALDKANGYQQIVRIVRDTFSGLSLGSILILMALGLSVIFGLMGVINMAHGEFMMIGAFTTYVVCEAFKIFVPEAYFDLYFIFAIPIAFLVSGFIGYLCEMFLIKHLYGRPFETILATWGLSLVFIQSVRVIFGDTLSLTPPSWLSGGIEIATDLTLPANRVFIIFYCAGAVTLFYLMINKTRLGLLLRATTQDRETANSLGVSVRKIDGLAFSIGAGLAGLAGCVVPLFDKINPSMGQSYVVDSFMVVVLGGVGKIAGAIVGGLGLGFVSKYIEPFMGAVYGKVIVLGLIVLFLQWKPSGLFPAKGRHADD
ncbi:MAG: urea ABC transporter permease subunit UrtB [Fibrobacterales bacterium]